ncbi:hypothetical protein V8E54_010573 [Elaphomyces granulatus]
MKSQTFINPNAGSLPSLIGITLGLTIPNTILARNLGSFLTLQARNLRMGFTLHALTTLRADLLTELSQSDKQSVRTHVPTKRYAFSNRTEMLTGIYFTGKFVHQRHAAIPETLMDGYMGCQEPG